MENTKGVTDTELGRNIDRQSIRAALRCGICGGEIYPEQLYYEVEGKKMCYDCLPNFARHYFLGGLKTAKLRSRRK